MYGLMMILATGAEIAFSAFSDSRVKREDIIYGLLHGLAGFVLGASLVGNLLALPQWIAYRDIIFSSWETVNRALLGNFSFFGGLLGGGIGVLLYCRRYQLPFDQFCCAVVPGLPLAYAISKIGCFFAGCCHGIVSPIGMMMNHAAFSPHDVRLFPVQLLESLLSLVIFFVLIKTKKREGFFVLALFLVLFGILRLVSAPLRAEAGPASYVFSVLLIGIGTFSYYLQSKKALRKNP